MSENRFTLVEAGIFEAWIQQHPNVLRTRKNAKAFGDYLENRGQRITMKNLDEAFVALRAEGALEIVKSPAEVEAEKIESVRSLIYAEVNQKLAPARIDFTNPVVLNKIATWLHKFEKGLMSVDRVLRAVEAHKFDDGFWVVLPANLFQSQEYVHGRRNYSKDPKKSEVQERIPGLRNHADDSTLLRESATRGLEDLNKIRNDEKEAVRRVAEEAINGFIAVRNGRVSASQTETIRNLLRMLADKKGAQAAMEVLHDMPDDARTENYIRARL